MVREPDQLCHLSTKQLERRLVILSCQQCVHLQSIPIATTEWKQQHEQP